MDLSFSKYELPKSGTAIFFIYQDLKPQGILAKIATDINFTKVIKASKTFKGKSGQVISILAPNKTSLDRILIVGLGVAKELTDNSLMSVGGKVCGFLNQFECNDAILVVDEKTGSKLSSDEFIASIYMGLTLKSYNFDKYFVDKKDDHKMHVKKVCFAANITAKTKEKISHADAILQGVEFTRDLVTTPPNILYPETFAEECKKLSKLGIKVHVLKEAEMKKLGMNALLGVNQGSVREPRLVVMEWNGNTKNKKEKPIAFVGKGVTFDSGGISIKPANGMEDMKYDMGGAGVVSGLMKTLALRKAKVNAIGVIGIVENMPSGSAQRPSDVVKSMSGQSIEILNTDAEGRLVLADALWYTQDKYKPKFMVNLATLTGAIVIALGENMYAGLFSNDDKLSEKLIKAGEAVDEKLWRMPLHDFYDKQINSAIADVRNTGSGRGAGSTTAAQFLQRFVNKTPWAHLDIAGMAWDKTGTDICPKGATGYGVRLLNKLVEDYFE